MKLYYTERETAVTSGKPNLLVSTFESSATHIKPDPSGLNRFRIRGFLPARKPPPVRDGEERGKRRERRERGAEGVGGRRRRHDD